MMLQFIHLTRRLSARRQVQFTRGIAAIKNKQIETIKFADPKGTKFANPDSTIGDPEKRPPLAQVIRPVETSAKTVEDVLGMAAKKLQPIELEGDTTNEIIEMSGIPEEHRETRRVRIYMPARTAMQSGWNNTAIWRIEFDTRERWENPAIGYVSSADPLSNISGWMDFATKEDAINICTKNHWTFEVIEPQMRKIEPKQYGTNFSWNKRTRVSTK